MLAALVLSVSAQAGDCTDGYVFEDDVILRSAAAEEATTLAASSLVIEERLLVVDGSDELIEVTPGTIGGLGELVDGWSADRSHIYAAPGLIAGMGTEVLIFFSSGYIIMEDDLMRSSWIAEDHIMMYVFEDHVMMRSVSEKTASWLSDFVYEDDVIFYGDTLHIGGEEALAEALPKSTVEVVTLEACRK